MKNILSAIIISASFVMVGCKSIPTSDSMYRVGSASGYTTAYILDKQASIEDSVLVATTNIITEVQKYVPGTNETFNVAWTPIMNKYVDKLVSEGKLTEKQGTRVKTDFDYITSILDAYIEKRGIKPYQDCVDAFVDGFCTKFLMYFKLHKNDTLSASYDGTEFDGFTEGYLSAKIK